MVRLVAVCRDEEAYQFESRQLPLIVDKNLTLVIQFDEHIRQLQRCEAAIDYKTFVKNYNILTEDEIVRACTIPGKDLFTFLSQMVPCVGCRRSVEQMFHQLAEQGHPALKPLTITTRGTMTIDRSVSSNPPSLYRLFYQDKSQLYSLIENILKNKKNKRCFLHSLEMQKPKLGKALAMSPNNGQACTNLSSLPPNPPSANSIPVVTSYFGSGSWMDIWNELSNDCKEEVVILDCEGILDLMEDYLKRHRFCMDCKSKVARAFGILVDEVDPAKESSYCSALYVGLRFCGPKSKLALEREEEEDGTDDEEKENREIREDEEAVHDGKSNENGSVGILQSRHIHVCCETRYIAHLLTRAEAEISGGRRERHAKTIDVAQEEVLTCISLYLYERLHRLWRQVRAEHQTWRVMFYVGVETLRKNFEICIEEKVGMGKLEALCEELEEAERSKEKRQEKKRQKKKRQKKRKEEQKKQEGDDIISESSTIICNGNSDKKVANNVHLNGVTKESCHHNHHRKADEDYNRDRGLCHSCDLGYSSYCDSSVSSREGSEVACSDGFCNHEDHDCSEHAVRFPLRSKPVVNGVRKCCRPCNEQQGTAAPLLSSVPMEGSCDGCQSSQVDAKKGRKGKKAKGGCHAYGHSVPSSHGNFQSRLLGMLKEEPSSLFANLNHRDGSTDSGNGTGVGSDGFAMDFKEEEDGSDTDGLLTAEEIAEFELNRSRIHKERIVLREKIRKNFEHFCDSRGDEVENGSCGKGARSNHLKESISKARK